MNILTMGVIILVVILFFIGIRIEKPVEKGFIETLGKYYRTSEQGFWTRKPRITVLKS